MEVMSCHGHLPLNDMEGISSVPPPLNQHLPHHTTSRALKKKAHKWLKDSFPYQGHNLDPEWLVPILKGFWVTPTQKWRPPLTLTKTSIWESYWTKISDRKVLQHVLDIYLCLQAKAWGRILKSMRTQTRTCIHMLYKQVRIIMHIAL